MSLLQYFEADTSPSDNSEWKAAVNRAKTSSDTSINYQRMQDRVVPLPQPRRSLNLSSTQSSAQKSKQPRIKIPTVSAATNQSFDKLFNESNSILANLVYQYKIGRKDVADLVRELGGMWTASSVIVLLERFGASRDAVSHMLAEEERTSVLKKLSDIRASGQSGIYSSTEWIQREVIASQRIELIDAVTEDFIE